MAAMSKWDGTPALGEVRTMLHDIRLEELPDVLRKRLARFDTNGNGIIDADELPISDADHISIMAFPQDIKPLLDELDEDKTGKLDLKELTEMVTVYAELKRASKNGSIAISSLPKEIQPTLKVFDVDNDGTVAPLELARGAELYKKSKQKARNLMRFSGVLLLILCTLVGVIVGLTAVVVEKSKETKTDSKTGITYAKGTGKPSATAKVTKTDSIYDAVKKSASALRAIGSLTLGKPDGSSLIYTITGAETHGGAPGSASAVAFYSSRGDVINVTATSLKVTKEDGTIVMTDTVVAEKSRRRRLLGSDIVNTVTEASSTTSEAGTDSQAESSNSCPTQNQVAQLEYDLQEALAELEKTETYTYQTTQPCSDMVEDDDENQDDKIKELEKSVKEAVAAREKAEADLRATTQQSCPKYAKLLVKNNDDLRVRVKRWLPNTRHEARKTFGDISMWDTSQVTDMSYLFEDEDFADFNDDISEWDTSKVTTMKNMFERATSFNQDIGKWNTAEVTDMRYMFGEATSFNQDIGGWNTAKVTTMKNMFEGAKSFNQDIGKWNTAEVTDMTYMFKRAEAFNQDISKWDTSKVTDMQSMFEGAKSFNKDIGGWNTSKVTDMQSMFERATSFNQDIGKWDTAEVINMNRMFTDAESFDYNIISDWDMTKVKTMHDMFAGANWDG